MAPRIKDVARLANVSIATVSRVLAGKPHASEGVRNRVFQAVEELQYRPSRVARSLRVQSSQIIGLIISDIQNPFFTSLVRAVEDRAQALRYAIFLCNTDENPDKEAFYVDLMLAEHVSGVIVTPTHEVGSHIQKLVDAKIPVVSVDRRIADLPVDTVVLDNISASFDLISYLISKGHQRIGAILASSDITTGRERYVGYVKALIEHQIPIDPALIYTGMPKDFLGYQCALELLQLSDSPTALFTGNNLLTIGALRAIRDCHLRIPEDISLVGFDDMDWTSLISPRLTVVSQPTYEIGQAAADLVLERIMKPGQPTNEIVFKPSLQIRESVASLFVKKGGEVIQV